MVTYSSLWKLYTYIYDSIIKGMKNQLIKMVATQTLVEYGIRMTSDELKVLVNEKMNYEIPENRWNQVVQEISKVSGMIDLE